MLTPIPVAQSVVPVEIQPPISTPLVPVEPATNLLWKKKFPAIFSGILAFLQYGMTVVIIGCEIGSVLIDVFTATIYVGFWASIFFVSAWISQASSTCCCRGRPCATYTLINQCIALVFAACIIGFDAYFISYPTTCFFSTDICTSSSYTRGIFYSVRNFYDVKIPLIKGQLAAASVMFVLCLISIALYIFTAMRVYQANKLSTISSPSNQYTLPSTTTVPPTYSPSTLPVGPDGLVTAPPAVNVRQAKPGSPLYHRPMIHLDHAEHHTNDLICPTCSSTIALTLEKKAV
ncbi:unnamed protein product [Adineta ricciae]|uniref:Uncharacterized protein n=2 Tax=Adineta ricciae TaxID=249248 RepID=A0A814M2G9_ADIRI|nr:unnamed protein product [Adineta ricciae]